MTSIPPNIDRFNRFSLAVLQQLYASFPVPIDVQIASTMMSVVPEDASREETWSALASGEHAMKFLAAEGFVSYKAAFVQDDQFMHVTLTMKGLSALGSVPSSLEKQATLFSKIKGVVSKGIKQASAEQVSDLAAQVFSYGLAAAPTVIGKLLP